jgi:hypothetical protein
MGDLINGFTPEEIKQSLKICAEGGDYDDCQRRCPFHRSCAEGKAAAAEYIERLEGKRDAEQAKPLQRPMTLEDVKNAGIVFVEYQYTKELRTAFVVKSANNRDFNVIAAKGTSTLRDCTLTQMSNPLFGKIWRAWASRPTDEERAAAKWEV